MAEHVQELINKIKKEGVAEAETQARQITEEAEARAKAIVDEAQESAHLIIDQGKKQTQQMEDAARAALKQAGRDTLLKLRGAINDLVRDLVAQDLRGALSGSELAGIIETAIQSYMKQDTDVTDIKVLLSSNDLEKIKSGFLAELKDRLKKPITLQSREDIGAGFILSFNKETSSFDFSDSSLVEYLSHFLNDELASLMKEV